MAPQHALVISTRSVDASSEKRVEPSEVKGRDKDTIFYWNLAVKVGKGVFHIVRHALISLKLSSCVGRDTGRRTDCLYGCKTAGSRKKHPVR